MQVVCILTAYSYHGRFATRKLRKSVLNKPTNIIPASMLVTQGILSLASSWRCTVRA